MKRSTIFFATLFVLALLAANLAAIETGEVQGRVTDETGIGLPGVDIKASGPSLQGTRSAVSGKNGAFHLPLLPVGTYTLTFSLQGFTTVVQQNVEVRLGMVTTLAVPLKFSDIEKEIVVTAPTPLIERI